MNQNEKARLQLRRLAEARAHDFLDMSEEEFLAELKQSGEDLNALAHRGEEAIAKGLAESGKRKLAAAREGYAAAKARATETGTTVANVLRFPISKKRELLASIASRNASLGLTMAARHGDNEATDKDVDSFIEDLLLLGVIDDDGKPK